MNFIDHIRQAIGNYFFKKDVAKVQRNRSMKNIDDAKTIALVFDASDEKTYAIVNNFVSYFQDNKKTVKALGYVNFAHLPHYCFPKLSYDYFTKRDINFYYKPKHLRVKDFMNEEFDILINLCMEDCFPLNYVTGLSRAKFKVGRYGEKHSEIYDFMLNVKNDFTIEDYMKEVMHYLSIINKNQDA